MTHKDIFTKFMIEYDKANVTSSYPSLTEYEIATVLDKAYMALIALKVTGNNVRRAPFEADIKSISDLQPLIVKKNINKITQVTAENESIIDNNTPNNINRYAIPTGNADKYLYFVSAYVILLLNNEPMDNERWRSLPVRLVNHEIASKFFNSVYNLPWIKQPVAYIEGNTFYLVYDPINHNGINNLFLTYIKQPNVFAKDLHSEPFTGHNDISYSEWYKEGDQTSKAANADLEQYYVFELNDIVAEELISLAISYALENIESPRLNAHLGMRGLES